MSIKERIKSQELTWYERCNLIFSYHTDKQAELGTPDKSGSGGWSIRDTARELELSPSTIQNDIQLAKAIRENLDIIKLTRQAALHQTISKKTVLDFVSLKNAKGSVVCKVIGTSQIDGITWYILKLRPGDRMIMTNDRFQTSYIAIQSYHCQPIFEWEEFS